MNYFLSDVIVGTKDAGFKARFDIEKILEDNKLKKITNGAKNIDKSNNLLNHIRIRNGWIVKLNNLKKGDNLVIQFPLAYRTIFLRNILKMLKRKGVNIILLIHDLDMYRARRLKTKLRIVLEEGNIFKIVDKIIVHNNQMKKLLMSRGVSAEKLVSLNIFDYLVDDNGYPKNIDYGKELIVAGSLRKYKVGFLYKGPKQGIYNLYGVGYTADFPNLKYMGSFPPNDLPNILKGSYGLIWDGDSLDTCTGPYGEYLRINNPHKTSLYLSSGIPVVIWKEAALADFVIENNVGIAVDSLENIESILDRVTKEDYDKMKKNAYRLSKKLRSGYFTMNAINKCI